MEVQCICLAKNTTSMEVMELLVDKFPLGAGLAFADKYNGSDAVTLCFMG